MCWSAGLIFLLYLIFFFWKVRHTPSCPPPRPSPPLLVVSNSVRRCFPEGKGSSMPDLAFSWSATSQEIPVRLLSALQMQFAASSGILFQKKKQQIIIKVLLHNIPVLLFRNVFLSHFMCRSDARDVEFQPVLPIGAQ